MKKIIIVGSTIQPRMDKDFTYAPGVRSVFNRDERARQTISSAAALKINFPNDRIVVVDSSMNTDGLVDAFGYLGIEYVALKDISIERTEFVNTNRNKSACECALLYTYMEKNREMLLGYDYIIKATGRYFNFGLGEWDFTEENKDKILFKKPSTFEWTDVWRYNAVDRRAIDGDNLLRQYCTVVYAFGTVHLEKFLDIYKATEHLLQHPNMIHMDIESLIYYMTRPYEANIIETDWKVSGWDGVGGNQVYY